MRAVVVESKQGESVLLAEDGRFYRVRGTYAPGETLDWQAPVRHLPGWRRLAAAGAAACLVLGAGVCGWHSYENNAVYAAVRLDGGPAVEYVLNRKQEVIAVKALDETAEPLAEQLEKSMARTPFEEALDQTLSLLEETGEKSELDFTAEVKTRDRKLSRQIDEAVERVSERHRRAPEESGAQAAPESESEIQPQAQQERELPEGNYRRQNHVSGKQDAQSGQRTERSEADAVPAVEGAGKLERMPGNISSQGIGEKSSTAAQDDVDHSGEMPPDAESGNEAAGASDRGKTAEDMQKELLQDDKSVDAGAGSGEPDGDTGAETAEKSAGQRSDEKEAGQDKTPEADRQSAGSDSRRQPGEERQASDAQRQAGSGRGNASQRSGELSRDKQPDRDEEGPGPGSDPKGR